MDEWVALKDIIGPLFGGALGFVGARLSDRSRAKEAEAHREAEHETAAMTFDQAQMSTITNRMNALMDGYEHRIGDLRDEVVEVRQKCASVQHDLDQHRAFCGSCANYKRAVERIYNAPDAAS